LREKKGQVVSKSLLEYSKIDRFNIDKESNLFDSLSKNKINGTKKRYANGKSKLKKKLAYN
jgi:hypothetical protein